MVRNNAFETATDENFDEIKYLLANPDVIRAGVPGHLHFEKAGRQEGRVQFKEIPHVDDTFNVWTRKESPKVKDFNTFSAKPPSHQVALDICEGDWFSSMPAGSDLSAGNIDSFADERVEWASAHLGGISGKNLIELGPFEGYNSYQFDRMGANRVVSIDNSAHNFLKCLIIKNVFNLRTEFLLGDFKFFKPDSSMKWDAVWASGVLYHLTEPVQFLHTIAQWADNLFIWTQYFDETILNENHSETKLFNMSKTTTFKYNNNEFKLYHRTYPNLDASSNRIYAGGSELHSYWMRRDDIMLVLRDCGFTKIHMGIDNPNHPLGPACYFLAQKN